MKKCQRPTGPDNVAEFSKFERLVRNSCSYIMYADVKVKLDSIGFERVASFYNKELY